MAMDRNDDLAMTHPNTMADRDMPLDNTGMNRGLDRETVYDRDGTGGSNFLAFLIGGLVIAVGLLAFLFYDGGNSRDETTTGSTTPRIERPATPAAPAAPAVTAPSAPAPANPQ